MRRTTIALVLIALGAGWAGAASAEFFESTGEYIRRGYVRNCQWPWPYNCSDRIATREPFDIMIRNGWRRQNMLGSYHFNPATNQLTTAGELHVRWIMTQTPEARRQVFVERSLDPSVTAARLANAREYATRVALDGQTPPVNETHLMAEGRPAATVDWTNVKFIENMPAPVLPPPQATAGRR